MSAHLSSLSLSLSLSLSVSLSFFSPLSLSFLSSAGHHPHRQIQRSLGWTPPLAATFLFSSLIHHRHSTLLTLPTPLYPSPVSLSDG
jgi:hypothetical protein